jgi:hypothetical protein
MNDVDLKNAFPNFEWDAIRGAVSEFVPEIPPSTERCHREAAQVFLPSCGRMWADRGAEQGDPFGSLHYGLALAMISERTKERQRAAGSVVGDWGFLMLEHGTWMPASSSVAPASWMYSLLRAFDAYAAKVGVTRGSKAIVSDVASTAKLIGMPDAESTTATRLPTCSARNFGPGARQTQFESVQRAAKELRGSIRTVGDTAPALALQRKCADTCKVTHLLRAAGLDFLRHGTGRLLLRGHRWRFRRIVAEASHAKHLREWPGPPPVRRPHPPDLRRRPGCRAVPSSHALPRHLEAASRHPCWRTPSTRSRRMPSGGFVGPSQLQEAAQ